MDLDVLRAFLCVARVGHLTRASEQLHLTQPAVSAQIKRLEEEVGQALFDRTPKGMGLTQAGEVFLSYAREALASVERGKEALFELEGLQRGSLRVGGGATATTCLFPPLLGRFHSEYPGVHLLIREQGSSQTMAMVEAGELDFGVITVPLGGISPRSLRGGLEIDPWVEDELRLIVPPKHPLAGKKKFAWASLEGQPMVLFEAGSAVRELIDARFLAAGVEPRVVMELRSLESIKQMVSQGIGAGFLSRYALAAGERGLACKEDRLTRQLAVVSLGIKRMSRAARAFFALMMEEHA